VTTATLAREAEVIARAREILARADADPEFPWAGSEHARAAIRMCAEGIREDLDIHGDLLSAPPRLHPVSEFPDLGRDWPDDALATALERVTEDIGLWTGALVLAVRDYAGEMYASRLSGGNNGGDHE